MLRIARISSASILVLGVLAACSTEEATEEPPGPVQPAEAPPAPPCPEGTTKCGEACVDTSSDPASCGACGVTCKLAHATASCEAGVCKVDSCEAGFGDCDGDSKNGCEADTSSSADHCGACGSACKAPAGRGTSACAAGKCAVVGACPAPYADCDGDGRNGCEVDTNSANWNCGGCGINCEKQFPFSATKCENKVCSFVACDPLHTNDDGDLSNGCEVYACTATSPDDDPTVVGDADCDGFEGKAANGIFVSPTGSNAAAGTPEAPVATITAGIAKAISTGVTEVWIDEGIYNETVTLQSGISLFGGYSRTKRWTRDPSVFRTEIRSSVRAPTTFDVFGMKGNQITTPTVVSGVNVVLASGVFHLSASHYAFYCVGCTQLVVIDSSFTSDDGDYGGSPIVQPSGANGNSGTPGQFGVCDGDIQTLGGIGGRSNCGSNGGDGGRGGSPSGTGNGGFGFNGTGIAGIALGGACNGIGGARGTSGCSGLNGAAGRDGFTGAPGIGGSVISNRWVSDDGERGGDGVPGVGGGGGSGGGAQINCTHCTYGTGNAGGGGGAGGCGGRAGFGGKGGGGSFGAFLVNSTGIRIVRSKIASADGGAGGGCGIGGLGGSGGIGAQGSASCTSEVGMGGYGGFGGFGGRGGNGGGGAGGPSYGVYRVNTDVTLTTDTVTSGRGGAGGTGSRCSLGSFGQSGTVN